MKKTNTIRLLLPAMVALALALVASVSPWPTQAAGDPIVIIVNQTNPVDNLSMSELKKIFMSDRSRWDSGHAVAPVMVVPRVPERIAFLKIVCGMNETDFGRYFVQAAFNGKSATSPREVGGWQGVKNFVATTPGAIGFIKAQDFHGDGSDGGVKSVKIDGLGAGESGYRIKM